MGRSLRATATVEAAPEANNPATGAPTISGTPQVGETLTASTSSIADMDGLTNVSYGYHWTAGGSDIDGATGSTYILTVGEQGQPIQVRVTFTDDADNAETLTSEATVEVTAAPEPLTVSVTVSAPASHDGSSEFTFDIEFSEEFGLSYKTLKFHAFDVTPGSAAGVTVVLPVTTDCDAEGTVCTGDGRKLSNRLEFTVSGPDG